MNVKHKNILNIFTPTQITRKSLMLLVYSLLPAAFVTVSIESTLIYLLLTFIFIILATFASKIIDATVEDNLKAIIVPVTFIGISTLVSILASAFFINYSKDFNIYTYLMAVSALPFMLKEDNKDLSLPKSVTNTVQSFIGFAVIMIVIGVFREVIGTGAINFGVYSSINYQKSLFPNHAITIFRNPLGVLLILGFLTAIINAKGVEE